MKALNAVAMTLVIIGALNWALVGIFKWDLVAEIFGDSFGETSAASRTVYIIVGAAGLYLAIAVLPMLTASGRDRPGRSAVREHPGMP